MDTRLKTLAIALIMFALVTTVFCTVDAQEDGESGGGVSTLGTTLLK